ncbi:MAG: hypothetical protein N2512_00315 [Armatimonadetes bacterium]|nr:hypothetical protein [Armatimonadota bacterium]
MTMRVAAIAAFAAVLICVAGCGGGGGASTKAKTASTYLDDQATLSALLVHWLPIVFSAVYREDYVPQCPVEELLNEVYWEGEVLVTHKRWRQSDCGIAEVFQRDYPDGLYSLDETIIYPDGTRWTLKQTQEWGDNGIIAHIEITFRTGARLVSTLIGYWDPGMPSNAEEGTVRLPDGRSMAFQRTRWADQEDLTLSSADGWRLDASFPCQGVVQSPDTSRNAQGRLETNRGTTNFTLSGGDEAWTTLSTTSGHITGSFVFGRGPITGQGTVWSNGQVMATISWDAKGMLRASYADGTSAAYTPSAAARDFMIDRWLWQLGDYGPTPR